MMKDLRTEIAEAYEKHKLKLYGAVGTIVFGLSLCGVGTYAIRLNTEVQGNLTVRDFGPIPLVCSSETVSSLPGYTHRKCSLMAGDWQLDIVYDTDEDSRTGEMERTGRIFYLPGPGKEAWGKEWED